MMPPAGTLRAPRPDLLQPAEVARLGGLEVVTEGIVEGFLAGLHRVVVDGNARYEMEIPALSIESW